MPAPQKRPRGGCDALSEHLRAIGRTPLLTPDEEISLGRLVQRGERLKEIAEEMKLRAGGVAPSPQAWALEAGLAVHHLNRALSQADRARTRMVTANIRLVVAMARRYQHQRIDLDDLIQEGTIGLIKAVERFDPSRGYRFSTYATWWIRDGLSRAVAMNSRTIRLPGSQLDQLKCLRQAQQQLWHQLGRQPTLVELAEATGVKPLDIREALFRAQAPLSLDASLVAETEFSLLDSLRCQMSEPADQVASALLSQDLEALLAQLPPQEAELLRWRYGLSQREPLSLSEVARRMGISRDTARGIERRANAAIRQLSGRLIAYLDA